MRDISYLRSETIQRRERLLMRSVLAGLLFAGVVGAAHAQSPVPGTNTPLNGCIEGRALRIINGWPACAPAGAPTLSSCGTGGSINTTSTDFVGQITTGTGIVTSCVMKLSKLYTNPGLGCLAQSNSSTAGVAGTPLVG